MRLALAAFLLLAVLVPAAGQNPPPGSEESGPVIRSIEVQGNQSADAKLVLRTLNLSVGDALTDARLRTGVKALYNLGLFADIDVATIPVDGGVKLVVTVSENARLTAVSFAGNDKIGTEDLKGKITLRAGQLLSRKKITESCQAIEKSYADQGYAAARCTPELTSTGSNQTELTFRVHEGPRVKIHAVEIEGNSAFDDGHLRKQLQLKRNSLFRRKRYTAERAEEDRARLEEYYRNHGYRDARVATGEPTFLDDGRKIALRFSVEEGPYYVFGRRDWSGNSVVTTGALEEAAQFRAGSPFSQEKLDQTTAQAYSLYTEKGYLLEISVVPETKVQGDTVNVSYSITEGRPSHVHEIAIRGNRSTKEHVIRREMLLFPGDLLRRSGLLRAQRDVFALGYFEDVTMDYEPTGEGTDVDLVFHVKEKSTGSASGGVGYSSDTGLTGTLELRHPNIFGNGQSISLFLERGGRRENYEISFQDPWILGSRVSFGFDLFNTRREQDLYTETRRGAGMNVGRLWPYRWPDYTRVFVGYSLEDFKYSEFDASLLDAESASDGVPLADRLRQSSGVISSTYLLLSRKSTDNPFYPTLGSQTSARLELAGGLLGGDQHYFKPTVDHRFYFQPVWRPVLMMRWRGGWLAPLPGGKSVPSTETFRLGGTRPFEYLRGYDDYYIVPEENVRGTGSGQVRFPGGRSMLAFTAELQFPVVNPVRGLIFYDAGDTWTRLGELRLTNLKESFGAGLRFEIPMLGQIGLDYGYGTAVKDWRFHFVFGPSL